MALPTTGPISLNQMHVEVGGTSGTTVSINDADIRGLISKASGALMSFSEWYGASAVTSLASGTGTTGYLARGTYNPGIWGWNSPSTGSFALTSGSYAAAFGAGSGAITGFQNRQYGTISGDNNYYFYVNVDATSNPATWTSMSATVGGTTTTFTRASATVTTFGGDTQYEWLSTPPFTNLSAGTAFTWSVS